MDEMTYKEPPWTLEELSVWAIKTSKRMEELERAGAEGSQLDKTPTMRWRETTTRETGRERLD